MVTPRPDTDLRARVVVADDDTEFRRLLAWALRRDGHDVIEIADGSDLLDFVGASLSRPDGPLPADLVISDVRMPGYNGLDVLASLRDADWSTPVILITAFGNTTTHDEGQRLGAVAVLDKPFDVDELRALVRSILR